MPTTTSGPDPTDLGTADAVEPAIDAALRDKLHRRENPEAYQAPSPGVVAARLTRHLRRALDASAVVTGLRPLTGGASKEQYRFDLQIGESPARPVILRCDPGVSIVETPRLREVQLMRALHGRIPVPEILSVDPDGADFGRPAMIAELVAGVQMPAMLPPGVTGIGVHFPEAYRAALRPQFVRHLVTIHQQHPVPEQLDAFGVPSLGTTEAALWGVNWWARTWREDLYEHVPLVTAAECWLRTHAPLLDRLSLVHGDYRTGNFLFDEDTLQITAILDWELGYLGDRHGDLAWMLCDLYRTTEDGTPFYCGLFPGIDELIEEYEAAGGDPIDRTTLHWFRVFCTWKQAILSLGCALRAGDGQSHQDVLMTWLAFGGYPILEALRRLLATTR